MKDFHDPAQALSPGPRPDPAHDEFIERVHGEVHDPVQDEIAEVTRRLGRQEVEGREAHMLVASRIYPAPMAGVWDAVTDPERIGRWFLPVSGEFRPGGEFRVEDTAGGMVLACESPGRFAVTWEYRSRVSWLEVRLTAYGSEATLLELRHTVPLDDERWREFGPGAVGIGWDLTLHGLFLHVTGAPGGDGDGSGADRAEVVAAWRRSDEGRRFMTLSGGQWCTADIFAGRNAAEAEAVAARCIAAYTVERQ